MRPTHCIRGHRFDGWRANGTKQRCSRCHAIRDAERRKLRGERMPVERFCAECFIPIDGRRPGCQACKQRDLYRRLKESNPEFLRLRNKLKREARAA